MLIFGRHLQEVDHDVVVSTLRYDEFGQHIEASDTLRTDIDDHDLNNVNIKAESEDPDFR